MAVSILILGALLVGAAWLANRGRALTEPGRVTRLRLTVAAGVVVHALHATEEFTTGFCDRFPALFDAPAMPEAYFLIVNGGWIAIWIVSILMLGTGRWVWLVPAWFLALGGIANLVAHPVMALMSGGYFPGLYSAPCAGIIGVMLVRVLR